MLPGTAVQSKKGSLHIFEYAKVHTLFVVVPNVICHEDCLPSIPIWLNIYCAPMEANNLQNQPAFLEQKSRRIRADGVSANSNERFAPIGNRVEIGLAFEEFEPRV